jgi:hypothetical protein
MPNEQFYVKFSRCLKYWISRKILPIIRMGVAGPVQYVPPSLGAIGDKGRVERDQSWMSGSK